MKYWLFLGRRQGRRAQYYKKKKLLKLISNNAIPLYLIRTIDMLKYQHYMNKFQIQHIRSKYFKN